MNVSGVVFRPAVESDLPALIDMLASDPLGAQREQVQSPVNPAYVAAFKTIAADAANELIVADLSQQVVAMLQVTTVQYLTHCGSRRATIEGVRVKEDFRGSGLGERLLEHAIESARSHGCHIVQLTCDKLRPDAIRFYQRMGFVATHEGMKLKLN
ncbi:MAG: GNAT family N-acetyltransferase [Pseudomonadota bacterium]